MKEDTSNTEYATRAVAAYLLTMPPPHKQMLDRQAKKKRSGK